MGEPKKGESAKLNSARARYNAEIVAGALMLAESRILAQLLLAGTTPAEWKHALVVENVLQKRSPATALRQAALIKKRLETMEPELWQMVAQGNREVATQALLAAAIKHSKMLGDFLTRVVKEHWRTFAKNLKPGEWAIFLEECQQLDPVVLEWSESTRNKLGQVIILCLVQAGYIENSRTLRLTPTHILPEIEAYLARHDEHYVLACLKVYE